jgi:hypothetical protein
MIFVVTSSSAVLIEKLNYIQIFVYGILRAKRHFAIGGKTDHS